MSRANAERAGLSNLTSFRQLAIGDLYPPKGVRGLVMVNPPYGTRLGERKELFPLYRALGRTLMTRFMGWRVGLVTSDDALADAAGLPLRAAGVPVPHGGLRVTLYVTDPLS
jgi:putative N6-adenine-specific DNA methylase